VDSGALAMTAVATSFWQWLPVARNPLWLSEVRDIARDAEARRQLADYDTGSISEYEAYLLRALATFLQAHVVIDVGTFIGTSACALASALTVQLVYTCDASNDCLPSSVAIETFPKTTSLEMLRELKTRCVKADLCFFDGVLRDEDADLLAKVTHPKTVFAVHDYNYGPKIRKHGMETVPRKGIGNIRLLQPRWPEHVLVEPLPDSLIALLVPESLL
jgi:predicted O-methyltransferase YrrM